MAGSLSPERLWLSLLRLLSSLERLLGLLFTALARYLSGGSTKRELQGALRNPRPLLPGVTHAWLRLNWRQERLWRKKTDELTRVGFDPQDTSVLGLRPHRAKAGGAGDSEKLVDLLLQARQEARKAKLFALGDKIRSDLKALGYEVEDLPGGKWAVKKKWALFVPRLEVIIAIGASGKGHSL